MRKPYLKYQADKVITDLVHRAAGSGSQELMIGCEILFSAGLASRELTLVGRGLTMEFQATPALSTCLDLTAAPNTKHTKS